MLAAGGDPKDGTVFCIDVLTSSGSIQSVELPEEVTGALSYLPEHPDAYFTRTDACELVPVGLLVASHIRNEGVMNANENMRLAGQNMVTKRRPVTIRRFGPKFLVLDGNSTFINAKFSRWRSLLCELAP